MNRRMIAAFAAALLAGGTLAGCEASSSAPSASSAQASQNNLSGTEASEFSKAVPYPYADAAPTNPLERENLATRLKDYNSAGDTNYVYLLSPMAGTPIGYYVIRGKVSSTGSEMTSTQVNVNCDGNTTNGQECTDDAIGDDGSYGLEEGGQNGVFFITTTGDLIETTLPWVVSSQPIRLYASVPQLDAPAK
jgi:hypothetical protein